MFISQSQRSGPKPEPAAFHLALKLEVTGAVGRSASNCPSVPKINPVRASTKTCGCALAVPPRHIATHIKPKNLCDTANLCSNFWSEYLLAGPYRADILTCSPQERLTGFGSVEGKALNPAPDQNQAGRECPSARRFPREQLQLAPD